MDSIRVGTLALACALGVALAGCTKTSATTAPDAKVSGPITDADDTGFKATAAPSGAASATGDPAAGAKVFAANCASCHGAAGAGGYGPKLKGEKSRKDYAAAVAWIKDPKSPMPKLYPSTISETDVDNVAAYVETL